MIDLAEFEEQFGLTVESRADTVDCGGDMLAHDRHVGACATHRDFALGRKQSVVGPGQSLHDGVAEFALHEIEQRVDLLGAIAFDIVPGSRIERRDFDLDLVGLGTADDRANEPGFDHQISDGTVAKVGPATWQAVGEVAVTFQVVAPASAPEGFRDVACGHNDGAWRSFFLFRQGLRRAHSVLNALSHGHIRRPAAVIRTPSHGPLP